MILPYPGLPHCGLSPRVRGNLGNGVNVNLGGGSIPACAGEPNGGKQPSGAAEVYPRVCGGTDRETA